MKTAVRILGTFVATLIASLAGERLVITEFMASNGRVVRDQDGDSSDWIEIHNAGVTTVNLAGWHLTDDPNHLTKWTFPATSAAPGAFLLVFASGKNRATAGAELHTSFQLDSAGEYLALVRPDSSVSHEFVPAFPPQQPDLSYGVTFSIVTNHFLPEAHPLKWLIPSNADSLPGNWNEPNFDDSTWAAGVTGFGFDSGTLFNPFIRTDAQAAMRGVNASALLRLPFVHDADEAPPFDSLTLRVKYDDGFIAYLNGVEIARRNAPASPTWNSAATSEHSDSAAVLFEDIAVTAALPWLQDGTNVLAIHALNLSAGDDDLLLALELLGRSVSALAERYFAASTPGRTNSATYLGVVADTKFSVDRGFYDAPFSVALTSATPGVTIRYTLNGSVPSLANGFTYSNAIPVDKTTTLRAAAFKTGYQPSDVDTHTYIFIEDVLRQNSATAIARGFPATWPFNYQDYDMDARVIGPNDWYGGKYAATIRNDLKAVPSLSLVMNMADLFATNGIYFNSQVHGLAWERVTSLEVIFADGTKGDQVNCGVRIQGNASRSLVFRKLSLRLLFKDAYGPSSWHYPIFGTYSNATDQFDDLVLRADGQEGWVGERSTTSTYLRDTYARETLLDMGGVASHSRWFHLYLNGLYWGLYELVERPDASFSSAYFGGDKDQWDAVTTGAAGDRASNGDLNAWNTLLNLCRADMTVTSNYMRLQGRNPDGTRNPALPNYLDVDNLIDYFIANLYVGTSDWPGNNYWTGRERTNTATGFKFYQWDADSSLIDVNRNVTTVIGGVAVPYSACRQNPEFRLRFADHVQQHFFNGGALCVDSLSPAWDVAHPERNVPAARFARLCDAIHGAIVGESARWGDLRRGTPYTRDNDWAVMKASLLNGFFPQRSAIVLQQFRNVGLFPALDAPVLNQHGGSILAGFSLVVTNPNVGGGTVFYTLDGSDPRLPGGALNPAAISYAAPVVLDRTSEVRARVLLEGNWSALTKATFYVVQDFTKLQLSEIMYNPPRSGPVDSDEFEFLELMNAGTNVLDLSTLTFTRGIQFTFPNGTLLGAGQYFVLARNPAQFNMRYSNAPLHGLYAGKLENSGETLGLGTALGVPLFSVAYSDAAPWAAEADNSGLSLQRMSFALEATNPVSWIAAPPTPGEPLPDAWLDSDGDGLPNGWEQAYGFVQGVNEANLDSDGDGLNNFQEFIAGTSPLAASDLLRLEPVSAKVLGTNLHVVLGFNTRSNKTYTVTHQSVLTGNAPTRLVSINSAPTNRFVTITDSVPTNVGPRFYRLATPKLP